MAPKPEWEYTPTSKASTTVKRSSSASSWYNPDLTEARATDFTANGKQSRKQSYAGYSTTPSTSFKSNKKSSFNSGVNRKSSFSDFISSINGIGSRNTPVKQSYTYPSRSSISNYGSTNTRRSTYRPTTARPTTVRNYSWMS